MRSSCMLGLSNSVGNDEHVIFPAHNMVTPIESKHGRGVAVAVNQQQQRCGCGHTVGFASTRLLCHAG